MGSCDVIGLLHGHLLPIRLGGVWQCTFLDTYHQILTSFFKNENTVRLSSILPVILLGKLLKYCNYHRPNLGAWACSGCDRSGEGSSY